MPGRRRSCIAILLTTLAVLLLAADPALAYVGPGAGLELVPYFLALLATVGVAFLSILLYPVYAVIRFFRGAKDAAKPETSAAAPSTAPDPVAAEQTDTAPK